MRRAWACVCCLFLAALLSAPSGAPASDGPYRFLLGQTLMQEGEYLEALEIFRELVASEPDESYVRLEYAELLFRLGRIEEAAQEAAAARELAPSDPEMLRLFGQIQLRRAEERPQALALAREAFEELHRVAPHEVEPVVTLGQIYLSQNLNDEAAELFLELLGGRPADRMLLSFLLEALQRADRLEDGEEVVRGFLRVDPGFLKAHLALAEIQSGRGEHAAAVQTLEGAAAEGFDGEDVTRQLAVELYRSGDSERALAAAQKLLAEQPDDFGARYLRALALVDLGRIDEARLQLEELRGERPGNLDLAIMLSRVHERERRPETGAEVLAEVIRLLTERGQLDDARSARLRLAELHARAGQWQRVVDVARELAGEAAPAELEVSLLLAEALARTERPERALEVLDGLEAGQAEPVPPIAAKRAQILFELERIDEARQALRPLAEAEEFDSILVAAEVYQQAEHYAEAIPLLERALEQDPESRQVLFRLGASLERVDRRREAEQRFRHLLELSPDFAPALNYLGYMWAERGENLSEALALVRRAVALDPDNGAYVDSLGWAYFQLGRYEEARGHLERAAELVPDDAVIYEHLGDLYARVGETALAQQLYEQALDLAGENLEQVRRKLKRLSNNL